MSICKEKPDHLPPLDAIGIEPASDHYMSRGGSQRGSRSAAMSTPPALSRQASVGLGISSFGKPGGFAMGQFATPTSKLSSEERFAMASGARPGPSGPGASAFGGRPPAMSRTPSQGGPGASGSGRTRSHRGNKRPGDKNGGPGQMSFQHQPPGGLMGPPLEPVAPLQASANRWVPQSSARKPVNDDSPEVVDRKVRGLLNKLTMERFESISDQIIGWANKSEKEKDGRTLIQVIRLVFEKATDEAAWSEMYARLCRKMMEQISPDVQDEGIRNAEGKPITGGQLFRKYLLNRCQEDFERGWAAKESTAAAAKGKASADAALAAANEGKEEEEAELYSEEYYAAAKAKRQGLGLVKFIGELFKLQMLTERIMHECIKKLLSNVDNPEEEEIESLCQLLTTIGQILDTPRAKQYMDIYFARMKELAKNQKVSSRMQFMLQDVIELRHRNWIPRNAMAAPKTIAEIHQQAMNERESAQRMNTMSRGGSRRGQDRQDQQQGDGWTAARPAKAGDLSNFGKISKQSPMTFGPSGIFASKKEIKESKRDSTISRSTSGNMFAMLNNAEAAEAAAKPSRPPSRKPSVDLSQAGTPSEPSQRRKIQLLPRSKPLEDEESKPETPSASRAGSDDGEEADGEPTMSEEEAKRRIAEDSKEFFAIRDLDEAEEYFTKLPQGHRFRLVDSLLTKAIESKVTDAELVAGLFRRAAEKDLCSPAAFEEGFMGTAEFIDDIAVDAPKAPELFAIMMKGAGLDKDQERRDRIVDKSMDKDKLISMLSS
ncbi:ARM repeat-containing protein [Heliocybe sulcata]|uniref:ARM repeat-containing protein n=1 Tax=Heliocybe sulcata TaxID=5364 RepID=A0A5C3MZR3_9AGAM|nr:ARM repeat-containing protein [Heliocybe sulcata]